MASSTEVNVASAEPTAAMRLGRAVRREDEVKPAPALRFRAERLGAGEAQVEAERDEVTLPAEELRTATTL